MTTHLTTTGLGDIVAALRETHASGRTRPVAWRAAQLRNLRRFCEERESEIAGAIESDLGRGAFEAWMGEISGSVGEIDYAIKNIKKWVKPRSQRLPMSQRPGKAWVQYEPLGVVLVVSPWNYPVYLALGPIVGALAAGNCIVLKPSEFAPASSKILAELLPLYLDNDAVAVVEGDGATTQELLALGFDHALFTGGTEIGRKFMAGAAPTLTPVTLELGGKSPVIVAADADLGVVARRVAWTKGMNSGQTCIAPDYVLVEESAKDDLVAELKKAFTEQRPDVGDGIRVINERQFDRLVGYLGSTSGTVALGGGYNASTLKIEPTIVVSPGVDDALMREEIFGPILPIVTYRTVEEATAFVKRGDKPLALYVFTKSKSLARRIVDDIPAGGAVINHVLLHVTVPSLPFGGVGASGMGAYHGEWGFQTLSHRKAVLSRPQRPDLSLLYPPYNERAQKLLRKIL